MSNTTPTTDARDFSGSGDVRLPSVAEAAHSAAESTHMAPTMTQEKPDKDGIAPYSPLDGHHEPESKEAKSTDGVSAVGGDVVDLSISPKTPTSPRRFQYVPRDERDLQHWITKAHTCVRQGHPTTSSDKDKDIEKLSEMVSQMTHLLAAAGIGRDTTARALAYMKGPDKADPKQALIEAKHDRKQKKEARRIPSGGSNKSAKIEDGGESSSNKEITMTVPNTSESSDPSQSTADKPVNSRGQNSSSTVVPPTETTTNGEEASNADGTKKSKKSLGKRRWWPGRGRRAKQNQDNAKENDGPADNTSGRQQEPSPTPPPPQQQQQQILTNENVAEVFAKTEANMTAKDDQPLATATNTAAPAA